MNRRDFFKLGAAFGAGAVLSTRNAAGSPLFARGAGIPQGAMALPESPLFATRHLVTIILGNGARTVDVVDNADNAPFQTKMAREGTLFTEDYGETANLHGYMVSEMLTGRDAPAQRPRYPTWNEYVRKKTGARATDFWVLQGASYYRAWTWDVKHFSKHPEYGVRYGATSLTMNKVFGCNAARSPADIVERTIEKGLGHTAAERRRIEAWLADVIAARRYELPSTRQPVIEREVQVGDCQAILLAGHLLKAFKPKMITLQLLGLDDAHADFGRSAYGASYSDYVDHIKTTDELIGGLWNEIQSDPYLRETTALIIRPECGRDGTVDAYDQLGHSPGDYAAHNVWTAALGPDFKRGCVVRERVQRRDLAPTITYLMSGQNAEYATGHVRTQMFDGSHRMPPYALPPTADMKQPVVNWGSARSDTTSRQSGPSQGD